MSKAIKGLFISDIHFPWNIKLDGVMDYLKDLRPDVLILGGDIIDAAGTYGVDSWTMERVERDGFTLYKRDTDILKKFLLEIEKRIPKTTKVVFLEGNHEDRYQRMFHRYPKALEGRFKFQRDAVPSGLSERFKWIPYGDYDSFFRLGDAVFTHGTIFPDAHAKKMAMCYVPSKTIYGHIHDFQAYTTHNGDPRKPGRYAVTTGCLCGRLPDYKKGAPNKWINGFTSFVCINGVVTTQSIIIENGQFMSGTKVYGGGK